MAIINKQDTNGTKGTLLKGEFGYDDYTSGGDTGRVYVGNGTANIALAKKSEVDAQATDIAGKLPLAGGTMTGAITSLKETSVAMPANDINLANGNLFTKTISGATTLTVSNVPTAGTVGYFILQLTNGGSATVTWFSGVKWAGGTAPTLTASGKDILSFYTQDGGTTWNNISISKDVK